MKLYLHIGTEKTGSSYLQTLLGNNREQLWDNGIHFPTAGKRENDMIQGKISPGNGQELCDSIIAKKITGVGEILERYRQEASDMNCGKVLISNELLVAAFSEADQWEMFRDVYAGIGFMDLMMLLFLRDPGEQALSLYKHRAKNGTAPVVEEWISESYHLPRHLNGFFSILNINNLNCSIRKYQKDAEYMENILFKEWLGLYKPRKTFDKTVNPSLSISELFMIEKVRKYDVELKNELYNRLLAAPVEKKAKDERIENYYVMVIGNHLEQYDKLWKHCNSLLPVGEKLLLPGIDAFKKNKRKPEKVVSLSEAQSEIIAALMADLLRPSLRWKLKWQFYRKEFGKLKGKLIRNFIK